MPEQSLEEVISLLEFNICKGVFHVADDERIKRLISEIRKRDEALNYLKGKVGYHNILCDVSKEPCFTCTIINKTEEILRGGK